MDPGRDVSDSRARFQGQRRCVHLPVLASLSASRLLSSRMETPTAGSSGNVARRACRERSPPSSRLVAANLRAMRDGHGMNLLSL